MYSTRAWIKTLEANGFVRKRVNGGHARYWNGTENIDVPIHHRELSRHVIASIKRVLRKVKHAA